MSTKQTVWGRRWERLERSGITYEQALEVWHMVNDAHGFGTQTIATSAMASLLRVYDDAEGTAHEDPLQDKEA